MEKEPVTSDSIIKKIHETLIDKFGEDVELQEWYEGVVYCMKEIYNYNRPNKLKI